MTEFAMRMSLTAADLAGLKSALASARRALGPLEAPSSLRAEQEEVCPLCLSRYAASLEQTCASCEAPSCPDCVARVPGSNRVVCFACPCPTTH
jgi:hypothetical protein